MKSLVLSFAVEVMALAFLNLALAADPKPVDLRPDPRSEDSRPGASRPLPGPSESGPAPNCFIEIRALLKTGEATTENFDLYTASSQACAKAAKAYEPNFAPQAIAKKRVRHRFKRRQNK